MRTITATVVVLILVGAAAPATAGGYDWLLFEDMYHRPGDLARGEAGVTRNAPMPSAVSLQRITPDQSDDPVIVAATVATEVPADGLFVDRRGDEMGVAYVVRLEFAVPDLPPGLYWVAAHCPGGCRGLGPWVGGSLRVVSGEAERGRRVPASLAPAAA